MTLDVDGDVFEIKMLFFNTVPYFKYGRKIKQYGCPDANRLSLFNHRLTVFNVTETPLSGMQLFYQPPIFVLSFLITGFTKNYLERNLSNLHSLA